MTVISPSGNQREITVIPQNCGTLVTPPLFSPKAG